MRWSVPGRAAGAALCLGLVLALGLPGVARAQMVDNGGLGPLSIRNQFPPGLPFLHFTPEPVPTVPAGEVQVRYQRARTNTFINTQSPDDISDPAKQIDESVAAGPIPVTRFPASGYGLYLDLEATRHLFRFNYGLSESLEVGLELAWVTFGGGFLDSRIEGVERFFGGLNEDRLHSAEDQFDYYVARNGRYLQATQDSFRNEAQEPVVKLKWNWTAGGAVLPAVSVKLAYKPAVGSADSEPESIVRSGGSDFGYYLLLSKAVGDVVGHFQFGRTALNVDADTYADALTHKLFGLEFRVNARNSLLLQTVSQSSLFLKASVLDNEQDFALSRPTDVLVAGYKHHGEAFLFEVGTIEDYFQQRNESDITLYLELGWQW